VKSRTRYGSRLSELFFNTNMVIEVLETVPRKDDLNWRRVGKVQPTPARAWHTELSGGASDSVRCPRLVNGELAALEKRERRHVYKSPDCPVSQRRQQPTVVCAINARHVVRANSRLGTPNCPVCTGQCPVRQPVSRTNGRLRPVWKEIEHRTVRCTTRQKARIAYQIDVQRLLAALGL
jgi:hypothetical protein